MWVFIPRAPPRALWTAGVMLAPAALLGALANLLVLSELARLSIWPASGSGVEAWEALVAFREHVEVLVVALFLVLALVTFAVVRFSPDAVVGSNLWASVLVGLLVFVVLNGWTLGGPGTASARIGMGTALWGVSWVLLGVHLFALLRSLRHRYWVWVTMGVGAVYATLAASAVVAGVFVSVEMVALLGFLLAATASFVLLMSKRTSPADPASSVPGWGSENGHGPLPRESAGGRGLVAAYMVLVLGLFGAAYQQHFDYRPAAGPVHHVLIGAGFLLGIPLFGLFARRSGRKTMLLFAPLAAFVPVILRLVQEQHEVLWALALAQGVMLSAVLFLWLYLAEILGRLTRTTAFVCAGAAVTVMGAGGSVMAQLSGVQAFTADLLLSLQFAVFFSAMLLAMALPEPVEPVRQEEEIEEYLEIAKRLSQGR